MCESQRTACASTPFFPPRSRTQVSRLGGKGPLPAPQYTETIFLFLLWTGVLCIRVHVCMVAYKHVCSGTRGSQNSTSGIGTRRSSHWSRAHPITPGIYLPVLRLQRYATTMAFLHGFQRWNLGHYACVASTLPLNNLPSA